MNNNGSKSSRDPKHSNDPARDPNKPYRNDLNQPYSSDEITPSSTEPLGTTYSQETSKSYKKNSNGTYDQPKETSEDSRKNKHKIEDTMKDTLKNIKDSEIYHYAASNKEQTITYVLLALGLIFLLFFNRLFGGLLVGMVAGYHFAPQIVYYLRNLSQIFEGQDQLRYIVLTGSLLGLLIAAPGIFIGAVVVAVFRQLIIAKKDPTDTENFINKSSRNSSNGSRTDRSNGQSNNGSKNRK